MKDAITKKLICAIYLTILGRDMSGLRIVKADQLDMPWVNPGPDYKSSEEIRRDA
jgi:hypothetical protein